MTIPNPLANALAHVNDHVEDSRLNELFSSFPGLGLEASEEHAGDLDEHDNAVSHAAEASDEAVEHRSEHASEVLALLDASGDPQDAEHPQEAEHDEHPDLPENAMHPSENAFGAHSDHVDEHGVEHIFTVVEGHPALELIGVGDHTSGTHGIVTFAGHA